MQCILILEIQLDLISGFLVFLKLFKKIMQKKKNQ